MARSEPTIHYFHSFDLTIGKLTLSCWLQRKEKKEGDDNDNNDGSNDDDDDDDNEVKEERRDKQKRHRLLGSRHG